jgi:DNA modification methylase
VILPQLGTFDLLCTDPPYGIGADKALKSRAKRKDGKPAFNGTSLAPHKDYGDVFFDDAPPAHWLIEQMRDMTRHQIIFGGNYFDLPPTQCLLIWDKVNGLNDYADAEIAWTNLRKGVRMIHWRWNGMLQQVMGQGKETRVHPTQKPEPVMRWCIKQAPADIQTVLDPFAGAGTTLLAAQNLGLTAVGIEREESYCEMAAKRLKAASEDPDRYIHDITAHLPPPKVKKVKECQHTQLFQ